MFLSLYLSPHHENSCMCVQFSCSVMSDSLRPHEPQRIMLDLPVHHQLQSLPKLMSIESVMPSNHLIFCCPLLLPPSIFPSIRVFSNEVALPISWPKYWNFSFNISPSNEHPGLISFRMDWLDLLAVQGTLKSLLQHHSSKASILLCSAFFIVQLSHPYMTTGKTTALTRRTFVDKVMSLLFNMLSRLLITFLPRSKRLLISWLQSPSAVILEPKKIKSATVSPSICHEVMGLDAMILVFWMLSFKPTFSLSFFTFIIERTKLFVLSFKMRHLSVFFKEHRQEKLLKHPHPRCWSRAWRAYFQQKPVPQHQTLPQGWTGPPISTQRGPEALTSSATESL